MCDIEILAELLEESLFVEKSNKSGKQYYVLKEKGEDAKLKHVELLDIHENSILLNIDEVDPPNSLFKWDRGQRRRCDYILIFHHKITKYIIYIELKSTDFSKQKIEQQFKGAQCLIDYCSSVLKRFHECENLFDQYEERFVLFYHYSGKKRPTKYDPPKNCAPDRPYKYPIQTTNPRYPSVKQLISR